ncbi:MAG: hypothetical protein J5857_03140 [Treponema sp.]|nr:hypothetical protein [Treponema sp.]
MYTFISFVLAIVIAVIILLLMHFTGILGALGGMAGPVGYFILIVISFVIGFFVSFYYVDKFVSKYDFSIKTYITTKQDFNTYEKVTKSPYGKENGTLKAGSVLKVEKSKRKKTLTWVEGWILVGDTPEYKIILIPEKVKIKESCDYFDFTEDNPRFNTYYELIDTKNALILKKIREDFQADLQKNGLKVEHSSDNVLRESIKETHSILPKNGYWDKGFFGLYEVEKDSDEFFYIEKKSEKRFKRIVNEYYDRLEKENIPYFEKRRK